LQDFGSQSSQIGPHLVQPFSSKPMATTLKIKPNRRNIVHHSRATDYTAPGRACSSRAQPLDYAASMSKRGKTGIDAGPATSETFRHQGGAPARWWQSCRTPRDPATRADDKDISVIGQ
jgi:hypothetical protein